MSANPRPAWAYEKFEAPVRWASEARCGEWAATNGTDLHTPMVSADLRLSSDSQSLIDYCTNCKIVADRKTPKNCCEAALILREATGLRMTSPPALDSATSRGMTETVYFGNGLG